MGWLLLGASLMAYAAAFALWLSSLPSFGKMFRYANQPKHREVMILFPTFAAMVQSSYSEEGQPLFRAFRRRFGWATLLLLCSVLLRMAYDYST